MAGKLTQKIVDQWLEAAWQDGKAKGEAGSDDKPDFKALDPRGSSDPTKKADPAEAAARPFDAAKCSARIFNHGHGSQCSRSHLEDSETRLCKMHHEMFLKLPEGKDIACGRYNQARPTHSLDKGDALAWVDTKAAREPSKKAPKLKVGELRDYLATRIPTETLKGLNKAELQVMYDKLKSESPDSDSEEHLDETVTPHPPVEDPVEAEAPIESVINTAYDVKEITGTNASGEEYIVEIHTPSDEDVIMGCDNPAPVDMEPEPESEESEEVAEPVDEIGRASCRERV